MSKTIKKVYHRHVIEEMIEHCKSGSLWDDCQILGYTEHPNEVAPFVEFEMVSVDKTILDIFYQSADSGVPAHWCVQYRTDDNGFAQYEYFTNYTDANEYTDELSRRRRRIK